MESQYDERARLVADLAFLLGVDRHDLDRVLDSASCVRNPVSALATIARRLSTTRRWTSRPPASS